MSDDGDILISLKPEYATEVFNGTKTVELRKRKPQVASGTRIWIYATMPTAAICGYANLVRIESGIPNAIWRSLGNRAAISKKEFDIYFSGCDVAHALVLTNVMKMEEQLPLWRIREMIDEFHPPQFFCRLNGSRSAMRLNSRKYQRVQQKRRASRPAALDS